MLDGFVIEWLRNNHRYLVGSIHVNDNLIVAGAWDKTISITPIILFPDEFPGLQHVINKYWLPRHLEQEIMDCFN